MSNKEQFLETVKVVDGKFCYPEYHLRRMEQTRDVFQGTKVDTQLFENLTIPSNLCQGKVKCRIIYNTTTIEEVEFQSYSPKQINSLKLVDAEAIDYTYKFSDRNQLSRLLKERGDCDEIIIVQRGQLTDTSYSNIVLSEGTHFYTPSTYLLNGTQRQRLLAQGVIKERKLTPADLAYFDKLYLINAMLSIEDNISVDIRSIVR